MKITRRQLKQIIQEELARVLNESPPLGGYLDASAELGRRAGGRAGGAPREVFGLPPARQAAYTQVEADIDELVADGYTPETARDIVKDPKRLAAERARGTVSPPGNVQAFVMEL